MLQLWLSVGVIYVNNKITNEIMLVLSDVEIWFGVLCMNGSGYLCIIDRSCLTRHEDCMGGAIWTRVTCHSYLNCGRRNPSLQREQFRVTSM